MIGPDTVFVAVAAAAPPPMQGPLPIPDSIAELACMALSAWFGWAWSKLAAKQQPQRERR